MNIRSKWIPEGHQGLLCYDGFYVDNHAVYRTEDVYSCWEDFTTRFIEQMKQQDSSFLSCCYWKPSPCGKSRFVLSANSLVDIVVETLDDYTAVYVLIPEDCKNKGAAKRAFPKYVELLKQVLSYLYPGMIQHGKSSAPCRPLRTSRENRWQNV